MPSRPNQIALTLPDSIRERLDAESRRTHITRSELIRMAVEQYLETKEREQMSTNAPRNFSNPVTELSLEDACVTEHWDTSRIGLEIERGGEVRTLMPSFNRLGVPPNPGDPVHPTALGGNAMGRAWTVRRVAYGPVIHDGGYCAAIVSASGREMIPLKRLTK